MAAAAAAIRGQQRRSGPNGAHVNVGSFNRRHVRKQSADANWFAGGAGDDGLQISADQIRQEASVRSTHLFDKDDGVLLSDCQPSQAADAKNKYNDSIVGFIAKSKIFEFVTIGIICLNAGVIGWDIDYAARFGKPDNLYETDGEGALVVFTVMENVFALYFTSEILIRFVAYRHKKDCLRDRWFIFDAGLVALMVLETWVLPFLGVGTSLGQLNILRLLRLLRITRMAKLMRAFPQLMMIVKGITAATKAVIWTFLLLIIITYTWAILFTTEYHQGHLTDEDIAELPDGDPDKIFEFFGDMGKSMLSLLVMGTILDDVTACTDAIRATGNMWMLLAFILYILINSFTMMNMLVGILVEVVGSTADGEQQKAVEDGVRESMMAILKSMDQDDNQTISQTEFKDFRNNEQVMKELKNLGIKEKHFDQYIELLFQNDEPGELDQERDTDNGRQTGTREEKKIGFKALLDGLCRLRPGQSVKALDFASFRQKVMQSQDNLKEKVAQIERLTAALSGAGAEKLDGSSKWELSGAPPSRECGQSWGPPLKINVSMFEELERTSSADIVNELQRRLGLSNLEETGVPLSMMDEELQNRVRTAEAFQTLGVPDEADWSKETMTC